jgi:Oxidoreductase molybdopterin binding domain
MNDENELNRNSETPPRDNDREGDVPADAEQHGAEAAPPEATPIVDTAETADPAVQHRAGDVHEEFVVEEGDSGDAPAVELADPDAADGAVLAESRRHTRRAFVVAAVGAAAGYGFYRYLNRAAGIDMQPPPLEAGYRWNADVSRAVFREHALSPTYPLKRAESLRVNGVVSVLRSLEPESWRLQVVGVRNAKNHPRYSSDVTAWEYRYTDEHTGEDQGHDTKIDPKAKAQKKMTFLEALEKAQPLEQRTGRQARGDGEAGESLSTLHAGTGGLLLTMDDLLKLPRHELVTQFKCIEGWSQIVHWAGVRMADFLDAYPPELIDGKEPRYVYMETPDGDYYTGYDMHVCRHPQTLLVTEMMGAPLTQLHGAPLRLHMPTKYGYKQIKRIGLISYTDDKPDDYWTKLGYDWYAGL